ncbi:MAG: RibD family protein, partial [Candidatus Competibacter sp.]|nr:RibD family protein [Candidatus Competibacter sp.]
LRTPPTARTLRLPGSVLIFTAVADPAVQAPLRAAGAEIIVVPRTEQGLDLRAVMAELARRECNEIHVESGPTLAGALLQAGLVDELVVYMAPLLLGDKARGLFQLPELTRMSERRELEILEMRVVGEDWKIRLRSCIKISISP